MDSFQAKNPNLGKFCMALDGKLLIYIYFSAFWNILLIFGIFYDQLVHIVFIFPDFGIMYPEKSGNPALIAIRIRLRFFLLPVFAIISL
jgi:hypothetical protein